MKKLTRAALLIVCAVIAAGADAEEPPNAELAESYYTYLPEVLRSKGLAGAELYLLRAADYAAVSSDLSFELARIQDELGRPRPLVLTALESALSARRWRHHAEHEARFLKARLFCELRDYNAALSELERVPDSAARERLALTALLALKRNPAFRSRARDALALYPDDEAVAVVVYRYARTLENPEPADITLIDTLTRRVIAQADSSNLIYAAAAFINDVESARRLLASRLARASPPPLEALPILLNLGVFDEETAVDRLFAGYARVQLLREVYALLRTGPAREYFEGRLARFTGTLGDDRDGDGIVEAEVRYEEGMPLSWRGDSTQERAWSGVISFRAGMPVEAFFAGTQIAAGGEPPRYHIMYDTYPAVRRVDSGAEHYYFTPAAFYFEPVRFAPVCGDGGTLFLERSEDEPPLSNRTLSSFAQMVERPSEEFSGAIEERRLLNGIVVSSRERLNETLVSETVYSGGAPLYQRVDTDLDGRLETIRHFAVNARGEIKIDYIEVDRDGYGTFIKE